MSKNDRDLGQMSLDFTQQEVVTAELDSKAARRRHLTVVASRTGTDTRLRQADRKRSTVDIYSREVTKALHAYAEKLGW